MELALFEPDIPQNTGTLMRLSACLGVRLHIIEPCGFPLDDKKLKRAVMDYAGAADMVRHLSWEAFLDYRQIQSPGRLILLSTHASEPYTEFAFEPGDILLLGRESSGVPDFVRSRAEGAVKIPMQPGVRSLNVAVAGAMVLGEGLRQIAIKDTAA